MGTGGRTQGEGPPHSKVCSVVTHMICTSILAGIS